MSESQTAREQIVNTGAARNGKVSVKIVCHPSGTGYGVETTVAGDRRYPLGSGVSLEQAQEDALAILTGL